MRQNGRSIGRWSLVLWLLLCWFLALAVSGSSPVTATNSGSSVNSISEKVKSLQDNFAKLERLWREQKIAYSEALRLNGLLSNELLALRVELGEVMNSLRNSIQSSEESLQEVTRLTVFFGQLEAASRRLSRSFQTYRTEAERQIHQRNTEIWIYRVIIIFWTVFTVIKNL